MSFRHVRARRKESDRKAISVAVSTPQKLKRMTEHRRGRGKQHGDIACQPSGEEGEGTFSYSRGFVEVDEGGGRYDTPSAALNLRGGEEKAGFPSEEAGFCSNWRGEK